jgi:hypothetical protein
MTAALPGTTTFMGVEMGRVGCEVSEVSSLTSQRPQLLCVSYRRPAT